VHSLRMNFEINTPLKSLIKLYEIFFKAGIGREITVVSIKI